MYLDFAIDGPGSFFGVSQKKNPRLNLQLAKTICRKSGVTELSITVKKVDSTNY